ncbi:unnamed protein product [Sphagnum jensenii]|uniref:Uncharacterized protein n=1 Tax=Sphagnum jensenii TaxID=128206 RepID=A0ABP1A640_9BRYO
MGMEVPAAVVTGEEEAGDASNTTLGRRPSILLIGSKDVGKRTILNRLIADKQFATNTLSAGATCHGWIIDTKYYTAEICIWMACLNNSRVDNQQQLQSLANGCEALVMVFDLSNSTSFEELQEWVSGIELKTFDILMCVGNKADCVPSHFGHTEYRQRLQKRGESSSDPHPEYLAFGIDLMEGSKLLSGEDHESPDDRRQSCIEWCSERGIEYIEACAVNEAFDQCLSVDGDLQGVARIEGALSAHMWPGLVKKPLNELTDILAAPQETEEFLSDNELDYLIEYELLSNASTEPWDGNDELWSFTGSNAPPIDATSSNGEQQKVKYISSSMCENHQRGEAQNALEVTSLPSSLGSLPDSKFEEIEEHIVVVEMSDGIDVTGITPMPEASSTDETVPLEVANGHMEPGVMVNWEPGMDNMEQLIHEMANMRENMRILSDGQRREMAAHLAIRMATMFNNDDEE